MIRCAEQLDWMIGEPVDTVDARFTLLVETPNGIYRRKVPSATPLLAGKARGTAAEDATRDAVAQWGLPDFVYRPVIREVASGQRELGDGIIVIGKRAVVIQVKCRNGLSSIEKESSWIEKHSRKGFRQAKGTIRSLRSQPNEFQNLRGRTVVLNGNDYEWLSLVVIDHPNIPNETNVSNAFPDCPGIALSRGDWEFLFDQLRSTYAVVSYLFRAAVDGTASLGRESIRYYEFAHADEVAPPKMIDPDKIGRGSQMSLPLLPLAPAGNGDLRNHLILRAIMEDVATSPLPEIYLELDRISALSELDQLPIGYRSDLGQTLLAWIKDVVAVQVDSTLWKFRRLIFPSMSIQFIFAACTEFNDATRYAFSLLVQLRHHQTMNKYPEVGTLRSVGIMLTPDSDRRMPWGTTMTRMEGDLGLSYQDVKQMKVLWPDRNSPPPKRLKKKPKKIRRRRRK